MTTMREIAVELMPHIRENVLAERVMTYGYYAGKIGRDAATESVVVGQAMHVIGAACILTRIPVLPLYYVKRADGEWQGVFESNYDERTYVLPKYDKLFISAREYKYSSTDFDRLDKALSEVIPKYFPQSMMSPHELWRFVINNKPENEVSWFERALVKYSEIIEAARSEKRR